MNILLEPASAPELQEAIRAHDRIVVVGARTKPRPSEVSDRYVQLSTRRLSGVVEYEPDEYTITALAGTPLAELDSVLAGKGQYLPFDSPLRQAGATLGGAVAADASGPGRFRYGGVRDFILGVRFADGAGRLLRVGGKVVKNAAGFDLPKFFVGSLGRFGVLSEITLKVLPRPVFTLTLRLNADTLLDIVRLLTDAGNGRWQPDALDVPPGGGAVCLRLAGPADALAQLSSEILARWPGGAMAASEAEAFWTDLREFRWAHSEGVLARIAITLAQVTPLIRLVQSLAGARIHVSAGGNLAFVSLPSAESVAELHKELGVMGAEGIAWRGRSPLWLGTRRGTGIAAAVKNALDPEQRFPGLED